MKKQYAGFVGLYMFSYFCIGALFPLLAQYLRSIGFDGLQIGTITASSTAIGIIGSPLWGAVYEKRNGSRKLLYILYASALVLVLSLCAVRDYWLFLAIYAAAFFFESPVRPLNDAITLSSGHGFGKVRLWGSVGFALGVFLAGIIAQRVGLIAIFPLYSISLLIGLLFLIYVRPTASGRRHAQADMAEYTLADKAPPGNFRLLLSNRKYVALIASAFFINGTMIAHNTYFGFLYLEDGGSIAGIGIAFLLMVGSEIPFMGLADRISRRIPTEKLIMIVMAVSTARFLWYGTSPSPQLLLATFFVQGLVNGIFLIKIIKYIARTVDKTVISSAITLYTAFSSNAGAILCLFAGGLLVEHSGGAAVYLFYGTLNLAGLLLYIGFGLHRRRDISQQTF